MAWFWVVYQILFFIDPLFCCSDYNWTVNTNSFALFSSHIHPTETYLHNRGRGCLQLMFGGFGFLAKDRYKLSAIDNGAARATSYLIDKLIVQFSKKKKKKLSPVMDKNFDYVWLVFCQDLFKGVATCTMLQHQHVPRMSYKAVMSSLNSCRPTLWRRFCFDDVILFLQRPQLV